MNKKFVGMIKILQDIPSVREIVTSPILANRIIDGEFDARMGLERAVLCLCKGTGCEEIGNEIVNRCEEIFKHYELKG